MMLVQLLDYKFGVRQIAFKRGKDRIALHKVIFRYRGCSGVFREFAAGNA